MKLILATEKIISSTPKDEWIKSGASEMILFTSGEDQQYRQLLSSWGNDVFYHVEYFDRFATNDLVLARAMELSKKIPLTCIIPMSEADILRAAKLRKELGLPGQDIENAVLFRNKIVMKNHALMHGVAAPKFKCIRDSIDLLKFIEEVGLPIVIKPIMGRGSQDTFIIKNKNELEAILSSGFISNTSRLTDLLAEEYIDADIYHIDGLQVDGQVSVMSVSKYINNCLSFVNGSFLGSYTLGLDNPLRKTLINYGLHLLNSVFSLPKNSLFHIEVFVTKQKQIFLCEVACRLGGNGINDEVMIQQGIDIKMEFIHAECKKTACSIARSPTHNVAARVLIPPTDGKLMSIPLKCDLPGVLRYQSRGLEGRRYQKMQMSNDEIANFLIAGEDEVDIHNKIQGVSFKPCK